VKIDLVLFDMAGTTVEDAGQVPAAFTAALQKHGLGVSEDTLRNVRGASKRDAIAHLVAAGISDPREARARTDTIYADFCRALEERFAAELRPVQGAPQVFGWLRARGVRVALNTGFDRAMADLIVRTLRWTHDTVDAVICGEDVPQGRPAPFLIFRVMEATGVTSVHRVATVGDTTLDLQAGWNAGVAVNIGVLSGALPRERLEQAPHTDLLESVAALPDLWPALEARTR
jgi:phosphonatase-like hydrolase